MRKVPPSSFRQNSLQPLVLELKTSHFNKHDAFDHPTIREPQKGGVVLGMWRPENRMLGDEVHELNQGKSETSRKNPNSKGTWKCVAEITCQYLKYISDLNKLVQTYEFY